MSEKKEDLFSEMVLTYSRTYFFDVKETVKGKKYLKITESKKEGEKSYKHNRIFVFEEDILNFSGGFKKALEFIMKK